jgi:hypothetical protein
VLLLQGLSRCRRIKTQTNTFFRLPAGSALMAIGGRTVVAGEIKGGVH